MGKRRVPEETRAMVKGGLSKSEVSRRCISNAVLRKQQTGTAADRQRRGRPPKLNERGVRQLLQSKKWKKCFGPRKPRLRPFDKQRRLSWCRQHADWTVADWESVMFSEKSRFELLNRKARRRVWRSPTRRCTDDTVTPSLQGGGGAIGIWGCLTSKGTGCDHLYEGSLKSTDYIEILKNSAVPSRDLFFENPQAMRFQHDNAPIHKARVVQEFLQENDFLVIPWPPYSPDLNPIEFLWNVADQKLRKPLFTTLADLRSRVHDARLRIRSETCKKLVHSMPQRCQRCIAARGGYFSEIRLRDVAF